jgi:cytochrome c peroxidase
MSTTKTLSRQAALAAAILAAFASCARRPASPAWEAANPIRPLPAEPLGVETKLSDVVPAVTPQTVRLGRWLFYDARLSADGQISCGSCHRPDHAFSEPSPVSTGIRGQKGARKSPSFVNSAWTLYPNFFWDGRARSLEEQALGPIANPIEMGNTHERMIETLGRIASYRQYFREAFGTGEITKERVARAIADYERTRMSGNSPWDRWKHGEAGAVSDRVRRGDALFFNEAGCNQCHLGQSFTDSAFHNVGIGWDEAAKKFSDDGRFAVTRAEKDRGAFKTPTLREVARHPPYMHDGSIATLRAAVEHYNQGGIANPNLDPKMQPLGLSSDDVSDLTAFMEALNGTGFQDTSPAAFPE